MSNLYDQVSNDKAARLDQINARKTESVAAATERKRQASFSQFDPDEWYVIDNDTLAHKTRLDSFGNAETMRLGFEQEGHSFDAFETRKDFDGPGSDPYGDNPRKADFHRREYARQFGKDYKDVSNDNLYDAGLAQTQRLKENLESLRGLNYTAVSGQDKYGRVLGKFERTDAFDGISGGSNAGYSSKFNSKRAVEDFAKGENQFNSVKERSLARALTGDAAVSAVSGGANAAAGLGYFLSILGKARPGAQGLAAKAFEQDSAKLFTSTKDAIKEGTKLLSSDAKVQREEFREKETEFLTPLYAGRKAQYLKADPTLENWQASLLAGKDEYADILEYLGENPGRILDASFESLPYMLGVGAVGRAAAKGATETLGRKTLAKLVKDKATHPKARAAAFMASKEGQDLVTKAASKAGVRAIATTEAALNSAEVYAQIIEMTPEQLGQSEEYSKLITRGVSHEDARAKMANKAFMGSFAVNFMVAGAAAKTGAGTFEANILRGLGEATKRGVLKTTGGIAGKAAIAGGKEFIEESIQSGGGELISQVASAEATGKEVGPGIGAATAEGGVIGLASGAGISATVDTARQAPRAAKKTAEVLGPTNTRHTPAATGVRTREKSEDVSGGTTADLDDEIQEGKDNGTYNAVQSVREILDLADADQKEGRPTLRLVNRLNRHYAEVKNSVQGKEATELKRRVKQYRAEYKLALKAELDQVSKRLQDGEITIEQVQSDPGTAAMLVEAQMVLEDGSAVDLAKLEDSPQLKGFLSSAQVVQEKVDAAVKRAGDNTVYVPKDEQKAADAVNDEKMGDGSFVVNGKTVLGLQAHARTITEAITSNDTTAYKERDGKLRLFLNSQTTKLRAYKEILDRVNDPEDTATPEEISQEVSKKYGVKVKHVPPIQGQPISGTAALIKRIGDELVDMGEVRKALGELAASELSGIPQAATRNAINESVSGKLSLDEINDLVQEATTEVERSETNVEVKTLEGIDATEVSQSDTVDEEIPEKDLTEPAGKEEDTVEEPQATPASEHDSASRDRPESEDDSSSEAQPSEEVEDEVEVETADGSVQPTQELGTENSQLLDESELDKEGQTQFPPNAGAAVETPSPLEEADIPNYTDEELDNRAPADYIPDEGNETVEEQDTPESPPVASEETSGENPDLPYARVQAYRQAIYQLNDVIRGAASLIASQVKVDDDSVTSMLRAEINNHNGDIAAAAQFVINHIVAKVDNTRNDIQRRPDERATAEEEDSLIGAAETLADGGKLLPTIVGGLSRSIDFMSAKVVPYIAPLVNVFGDPTIPWTDIKLSTTRKKLRAKFKKLGLPVQIRKAIKNKSSRVTNILAAVPNVMSILQKQATRIRFFGAVSATNKERQGMNGVIAFATEYMNILNGLNLGLLEAADTSGTEEGKGEPNTTFTRQNLDPEKTAISNPLQEYLFQFLLEAGIDPDGKEASIIHEQVAAIMAVESASWISSGGASTLNNHDSVINTFLSRNETETVYPEERAVLGNGTLHSNVVRQLGAKVLKEMNVTFDSNLEELSPSFKDALEVSIGLMMTATMAEMNRVEIVPVGDFVKRNGLDRNSDADMNLIYAMPKDPEATDGDQFRTSDANEKLRVDFQSAGRILKDFFSVVEYRRGPSLDKVKAPTTISGGNSKAPQKQQQNIQNNSDIEIRPIKSMVAERNRFREEDYLEQVMGTVPQDVIDTTVHTGDDKFAGEDSSIASKNARNKRSYDHVTNWLAQHGFKPFYYAYNMISSHRIMIDSNTINGQADSDHRFIFGMKEWDVTMKSTSLKPKGAEHIARLKAFKVAVALALDIDTEGNFADSRPDGTRKGIVELLDEKLNDPIFKDAIDIMRTNPESYTREQAAVIGAAIREGGEATHTLAGLRAWADFVQAGVENKRSVKVTLPMEIDGKTNGYATLLMQFAPRTPEEMVALEPFYNAVGVFFKKDAKTGLGEYSSYPEYIQNGNGQDNYWGVTNRSRDKTDELRDGDIPKVKDDPVYMNGEQAAHLKFLRENKIWQDTEHHLSYGNQKAIYVAANRAFQKSPGVLSVLASGFVELNRAFAKGPLTQVAYSASMGSVRRGLRKLAVSNFYKELAKAGHEHARVDENGNDITNVVDVKAAIVDVLNRQTAIISAYNNQGAPDAQALNDFNESRLEGATHEDLINFRRTYVMSKEASESFQGGIDLVYGHSLQSALEERLEVIVAMTQDMNDSVYLANLIFTHDFRRRIAHREQTEGTLTDGQRKQIINQMIREGLVPMVKTPMSQSQLDSLETTSMGTVALKGDLKGRANYKGLRQIQARGYNASGNPIKPPKQRSSVAALTGVDPNMNIGVGAIAKSTHSVDGSVNGDVMGKFPILNLFDASFGNFETIVDAGTYANQRYWEHNKGWSMGQAFFESLEKMLPLIAPGDSRISKSDKIAIIGLFHDQRKGFSNADHEQAPQEHFEKWLDQFRKGVNENNEAREALFAAIGSINQFAKEDTVHTVPSDDTGAVNPKTAAVVSETSWATGLLGVIRGDEANAASHAKHKVIGELLRQLIRGGNTRKILNNWMDTSGGIGHGPTAENMLDALFVVYSGQTKSEEATARFADIINTIRPQLDYNGREVRVKLASAQSLINPENNQQDAGRYEPETNTIWISDEARDPIGTILHESIHAANFNQLKRLSEQNSERFNEMLADAKAWRNTHIGSAESSPERRAAMSITAALTSKPDSDELQGLTGSARAVFLRGHEQRQMITAISEYTAHLNGELRWKQGKFDFHFYSQGDVTTAAKALTDSVQTPKGNRVYYSSTEEVDDSLFSEEHGELLTKDNLTSVLARLKETESLPADVQQLFTHLIEGVLTEGLASIDSVIYKMANSPTGERNVGKVLVEAGEQTVYVQTTNQNQDTSPVSMSAQEVAIHEILHAVLEHAINTHPQVQKEIDKLFNRTLEALTKSYDGYDNIWKAFLPTDSNGDYLPGVDPALDEKLAKQRFEHIFGDPTAGKDYTDFLIAADPAFPTDKEIAEAEHRLLQSGNKGKHEFIAIGLSNPQFIKILQGTETVRPGPIWVSGKLVESFHRLLTFVMNLLKGEIFTDHKTDVSASLQDLSKKIIAFNTKQQALAKKRDDEGAIQDRINGLNNFAVAKLAGLVTKKMSKWAEENNHTTDELRELQKQLSTTAAAVTTAKAMGSDILRTSMEEFRDALDAAVVEKDHFLYEMLTEILPWADRNRSWVDMLRRSEVLIDGRRQQLIEHTRTGLHNFFENAKDYTQAEREAITNVMLKTDLVALIEGDSALDIPGLLELLTNPDALKQRTEAFEQELDRLVGTNYANMYNKQSKGLASYMMHGVIGEWMQQLNIYGMVNQRNLDKSIRIDHGSTKAAEIADVLEHLTSMRALALLDPQTVDVVAQIMTDETNRDVEMNGFNGMIGMAQAFKDESFKKLFRGNPSQMIKGYVYEILDEEVGIEAVAYTTPQHRDEVIKEMKEKGFTWMEDLPRDDYDNNPAKMMLFKQDRGIATYSKSYMSLTGEQKRGTGLFDSLFSTSDPNQPSNVTAARGHGMLARTTKDSLQAATAQFSSTPTRKGVKMVPVYNEADEIVDFRYVMSEANKKEHMKKRDYFDEVLPRMFASIEDRVNTKTINEEGIDALYKEWVDETNKEDSEARFVAIGKDVVSEEGREMWALLPKATQLHVEEIWGDKLFYVRDETVNLVLGFRKMTLANNKVLAPISPAVRIAEKIWQEIIQWERFRIAVLNPVVVIGNVVSNIAMLLSQGITPAYIWRNAQIAIVGMRKYQKDLRKRNELNLDIQAAQALHKDTRAKEAQLARLNANLNNNPVQELVEEGLFTSIVEEFGLDEQSTRRKLTSKALDKVGHITGSKAVVKVAQEAMMVPGSELASMALMATQYGDFVGRFIKFNWDTKVKGVDRTTAIHEALDSFIYYNIPQNRILQAMNDNGLMMFTKFFFRIQPIIGRTFKRNPVQASITLGLQHSLQSRTAEENIANYAFMSGGSRKFDLTPWDRITSGEIFEITALKWIPDIFWKE